MRLGFFCIILPHLLHSTVTKEPAAKQLICKLTNTNINGNFNKHNKVTYKEQNVFYKFIYGCNKSRMPPEPQIKLNKLRTPFKQTMIATIWGVTKWVDTCAVSRWWFCLEMFKTLHSTLKPRENAQIRLHLLPSSFKHINLLLFI